MFSALAKAFAQLTDPALRRVLRWSILGALASYAVLVALAWALLSNVSFFQEYWADLGAGIALFLLALVLPVLFFPALVTAIMSPMLESVADAVEARHYPGLNWPRPQKWTEVLLTTLRFLVVLALVNALALPFYVVLAFTGFGFILSYAVNGYLLGREYYEIVALRRLEGKQAAALFRRRLGPFWLAGIVIAFLFSIPFLNLAAPILGTAFMVHRFQSLRAQTDSL